MLQLIRYASKPDHIFSARSYLRNAYCWIVLLGSYDILSFTGPFPPQMIGVAYFHVSIIYVNVNWFACFTFDDDGIKACTF